jgi:hypothetical protein
METLKMKHRTLAAGLDVSAIGIGCIPMIREGNINYGQADDDQSVRTIHEAIDLGVTFFDTAEMYGPFANEELVGRAIKGRREGLVIATKFAMRWEGDTAVGLDGSPANARRACEGSLKRLGGRGDRPVLPAPCRSQDADRGDGGRPRGPGDGGQDPAHRPFRSGRRDPAARGRGPPDRGPAERVFDLGAGRGG